MRTNTRLIAVGILALCSVVSPFVSAVLAENVDPELNKLQGTWILVSGEKDGKKLTDEEVSKNKITYQGQQGQVTSPHQSKETILFDIVKIDPTKSPKEFIFIRKTGPSAGKSIKAIYEFTGNDEYKFAFDPSGVTTPKEFATKAGTGYILNTWKRVKP